MMNSDLRFKTKKNTEVEKELADFPVVVPIVVRFRDLDPMGHVNNAVYFTYLEMARVAYYQRLGKGRTARDFDFVLAEVTCRYRSPASLGETLLVGIRVPWVGSKSFGFKYKIYESTTGRLVAEGHSVQVMYDYEKQQTRPVSDELIAALEALEGHHISRRRRG